MFFSGSWMSSIINKAGTVEWKKKSEEKRSAVKVQTPERKKRNAWNTKKRVGGKKPIGQLEAEWWKDDCVLSASDECRGCLLARTTVCAEDRGGLGGRGWRGICTNVPMENDVLAAATERSLEALKL